MALIPIELYHRSQTTVRILELSEGLNMGHCVQTNSLKKGVMACLEDTGPSQPTYLGVPLQSPTLLGLSVCVSKMHRKKFKVYL